MRFAIAIVVSLAWATHALAADTRPRCESCGMFWDVSSTRIEASIKADGKAAVHKYESLSCMTQGISSGKTLVSFKILDYSTASSKTPKLVDGKKAWYLYGTKKLKGSMPTFIAAFSTKDAANATKKDLGGELMQWDKVWKKLNE